jgi:hypothetical protein
MTLPTRAWRAGESLEDFCRACKTDRLHTIIAVDAGGRPIRVACGYCRSEHNFRGGPRVEPSGAPARPPATTREAPRPAASSSGREAFPLVSDRERTAPPMAEHSADLELLLRRIIREETGLTPAVPAAKWRGGTLVLKPGNPDLQERTWPIDTLFHKIVMIRNRLRMLEQQVNGMDLPEDVKVKLQGYITGCYGSLTSFNVLFADEADHFKGAGGDEH